MAMSSVRSFVWCLLLVLTVLAGGAAAGEVRVFKPMEEGMSTMQLRSQAMSEGFAQAVLEESEKMLAGKLDETRAGLFREYLLDHAKPYIQGYKIISSEVSEAGVILRLDVQVNKTSLRDGLKRMGFLATLSEPLSVSVVLPDDLDEETRIELQNLVTLTGLQVEPSIFPLFTLERGKTKGTFKGRMELEDREWMAVNKNVTTLWFDLWGRFFSRSQGASAQISLDTLSVAGWFSPDAVLEFDRVLRSWDSSVQDVRLVEMDMQPTGVGATWTFRLVSRDRLNVQLQGFLPQRGLSFKLTEKEAK